MRTAFGCIKVVSAALPASTINVEPFEPHYFASPVAKVKDLGLIKAGAKITVQGTVGSTVLSNGSLEGTDQSDYLRFSVPPA